ncbi:MAG: type 4a pilus biogenesis protein PilO [Burkholderiales bacterium]|jgi:type IV pilus assembly protein PilO|nr:type 4a pilus biogenesis protein PilO [Burkholderiales bacterium]
MSLIDDLNKLNLREIGIWPAPFKIAAMVILFALIVTAGYFLVWRDQFDQLDRARQEEQKLRNEFLEKKKQAVNLDLYRQQLAEIEQAFGALVRQLPNKSEMDALITDINQAGLGRGLEFELFKPGQETIKGEIAELPIAIKVSGDYHDLGRFASDIAQLPRIVNLRDINIYPAKDGKLIMEATAVTYRYLDEEELAAQRKAAREAKQKGGRK